MRLSVQIEFDKTLDLFTHKDVVIVGRAQKCDLVIPHDSISRQHCRIEKNSKGQYCITDLASSNGVLINEEKIPPNIKRVILPGNQLSIGGLQCEVSEYIPPSENKVVSSTTDTRGDFTATIRLARIDLNQPSPSLELEKKKKSSRPRNPVTAELQKEPVVEKNNSGWIFLLLVGAAALGAAWYFGGI
jgi:predicted component of type VI protein secretion system